jgi:hypothetical protein
MSRKPTIKISYPDASDVAMKLTEAMVRRAPGRRVVETTSEDSASPAGGELFADFDACSTSTSVDLTLTLNSASMDYALETLIRPNLTTDERKRILGEDSEQIELLIPAHAAEAPGQTVDGSSSPDVPSAERGSATQSGEQEEKIEIGKISAERLSEIIGKVVADAWMDYGDKDSPTINEYIDHAMNAIREAANMPAESEEVREARNRIERYLAVLLYIAPDEDWDRDDLVQRACDANDQLHPLINQEYPEDIRIQDLRNMVYQCEMIATKYGKTLTGDILEEELEKIQKGIDTEKPKKAKKGKRKKQDPSWDDVEAEARKIGMRVTIEPGDNTDSEIDAGLLNDVEDEDHAE